MTDMQEVLSSVLADHVRTDWSDGTYACGGCKAKNPNAWKLEGETEEEAKERRDRYDKILYPGWSLSDYNAHVARNMVRALDLTKEASGA